MLQSMEVKIIYTTE